MIDAIVDNIENALSLESYVETSIANIKKLIEEEGTNRYNCCYRLLYAYRKKALVDFCSHLRQSILMLGRSIRVKPREFFKAVEQYKNDFGFTFEGTNENIKVSINPNIVPNEDKISSIYEYKKLKSADTSIGDGRLYRWSKYPTYSTFSQKILLKQISRMNDGDTLLASLPTGGGKSMSWQLSGIAKECRGLIIVIVPTIALAIDHARKSRELWQKNNEGSDFPAAYIGDLKPNEKQEIKKRIMSGMLPILYISPEALLNNEFKEMIIQATSDDKVSMLVIDEAHLITGWAGFRPEFQLIPSLRNIINDKCSKIKTVLLSATLNENDSRILKRMFASKDDNWIEIRADALRPELEYRMRVCENKKHREELTTSLINQAPKPMIIYTMHLDPADHYYKELLAFGYKNVRLFTGRTGSKDRERILSEWNNDEVDIIVATSAFGMGVDKSDIRTIIHTFVPENINRFFQETGRAGRDGYSALSYWLVNPREDKDNAREMTSSAVPKSSTIAERWTSMRKSASIVDGDCAWVNISVAPDHLKGQYVGSQNAGWNQAVLLFLYRNGFIDIVDVKAMPNNEDYQIKVRLLRIKELEDFRQLERVIEPYREEERQYINKEQRLIEDMLKDKDCYSQYFVEEYPNATAICSGCQYCFNNGGHEFYYEGQIRVKSDKPIVVKPQKKTTQLGITLQINNEAFLIREDSCDLVKTVVLLADSGVDNIVLPDCLKEDEMRIVENSDLLSFEGMLLSMKEFLFYKAEDLLVGTTAIIMDSKANTKRVFEFAERYLKNSGNKIVFLGKESLIDERANRPLKETINAAPIRIKDLV